MVDSNRRPDPDAVTRAGDIVDAIAAVGRQFGVPRFIQNDPGDVPAPLRPVHAYFRGVCDRWASAPDILRAPSGQFMTDMCGGYLGNFTGPVFEPGDPPLFEGGQCPDVAYRIVGTNPVTNEANGQTVINDFSGTLFGPLGVEEVVEQVGNQVRTLTQITGFSSAGGNPSAVVGLVRAETPLPNGDVRLDLTGEISIDTIERIDGLPDDCGSLPGEPGRFVPGPGAPVDPPTMFVYEPPGGGPSIAIDFGDPELNVDGTISLPVTIDGVEFDFGGATGAGTPTAPTLPVVPNYDDPGDTLGPDPNNPPSPGEPAPVIDFDGPVAAVVVNVVIAPPNSSREVGGPENILIDGPLTDAGWLRWKDGGGNTKEERIVATTQLFRFSLAECVECSGFQVKFSPGYSGNATPFRCS